MDHQYTGTTRSYGLWSTTRTYRSSAPSGSHASRRHTRPSIRSYAHSLSTSESCGPATRPAETGELVSGQWPVKPRFHSTPPENQA